MALQKCPLCKNEHVLFVTWFRDPVTNLDNEAVYCRHCYRLTTFVGSLNPFTGFRKHLATYPEKMTNLSKEELLELDLPNGIFDAIILDKENKNG